MKAATRNFKCMFIDRLTLDAPRRTKDGYMAVRAKSARVGTYSYDGSEIDPENKHGLRDAGPVNVLRDENTVFDETAARSFIGKPVTDDHPSSPVTASNWRDVARGMVMGAIRDGDYLAFDLLLTDAATIQKIQDGKRELSNGYTADLEFGDFTAPDGTKAVARQASISGNHVAIVDRARAGSACRIADAAICDAATVEIAGRLLDEILTDGRTYSRGDRNGKNDSTNNGDGTMPHTLIIDGLQVTEVSDQAKTAIEKLQGQVRDANEAKTKAEGDVATLTTDKAKLEGEKVALEQQLKDAKDPAKLQAAATVRAELVNAAKAVSPNIVTDGKSDGDIRKEVVTAKLGDDAKDFDDAKIEGAFAMLTKDAPTRDPVRTALANGVRSNVSDSGASVRNLARAAQY